MKKLTPLGILWAVIACAIAQAGPTFNLYAPAAGIQKNTGSTYVNTPAASTDIGALWIGTGCLGGAYLMAQNGTCQPEIPGLVTFDCLSNDGSSLIWRSCGTGTPAGSSGQVQYNAGGGLFGASSLFTFNSTTGAITVNNLTIAPPPVTDSTPIIQPAQLGMDAATFTGNYYSDPSISYGYNICISATALNPQCNAADWGATNTWEQDYEHQALGVGYTGNSSGTATASTTTTVLHDTAQALPVNGLVDYVLYDVTRSLSSLVTANTATTITVAPAITGMASGDSYQILRRDSERYEAVTFGSLVKTGVSCGWTADKGRSLASGLVHEITAGCPLPMDSGFGFEFLPDSCNVNCQSPIMYIAFGNTTINGHLGSDANQATTDTEGMLRLIGGSGQAAELRMAGNNQQILTRILEEPFGGTSNGFELIMYDGTQANPLNALATTNAAGTLSVQLGDSSSTASSAAVAADGASLTASHNALTEVGITTGTNADTICVTSGGLLTLQASTCTISSRRFKTNIQLLKDASAVLKLQVHTYQMKQTAIPNKDPNFTHPQIGLIAEEVAAAVPQCAVYENDMTTPKSYRPECITALLVRVAQDHQRLLWRQQLLQIYFLSAWCVLLAGQKLWRWYHHGRA